MNTVILFALFALVLLTDGHGQHHGHHNQKTTLYQSDFDEGTYRIRQSGIYELGEDIIFAPAPENDYWNFPGDQRYPMSNYFLGFFAAITIETDDVTLDLKGHTIKQSDEFYLLQRFFNIIELGDRPFVQNEGVSSLNYQKGDKNHHPQYDSNAGFLPDFLTVSNIKIQNGVLGQSSHAGIHGNGAFDLVIKNLEIRDFEVAGIQCNGCQDVQVYHCTVGPSATNVPVLATFANARFLDLYVNRLIPMGYTREGAFTEALLGTLNETISFADRPNEIYSLQDTFQNLHEALEVFKSYKRGEAVSPENEALLQQTKNVFENPSGLPDGSVVYGILFNKNGLPHKDDNFYGAGEESNRIEIKDTTVTSLKARPRIVPSLRTPSGHFLQGPNRDVIRITDIVSDDLRAMPNSYFKGNFLIDAYISMWKASNLYYKTRVYDSDCGNFGSNATAPYEYPHPAVGRCAQGTKKDLSLSGRDIVMLQKRYFGGITLSQNFYDWATIPGTSISTLLSSDIISEERKIRKHDIVCEADTMFHVMQGVIGIKLVETNKARLKRVRIENLENVGDSSHWVCGQSWKLPATDQVISVQNFAKKTAEGASIKGIQIQLSDEVELIEVEIKNLNSDEGNVYGIQVRGDTNDRSDYEQRDGLEIRRSSIKNLQSGGSEAGFNAIPFDTVGASVAPRGLEIGEPETFGNSMKNPKHMIVYGMAGEAFTSYDPSYILPRLFAASKYNTPQKAVVWRTKVINYFSNTFGLTFAPHEHLPIEYSSAIKILDENGNETDSSFLLSTFVGYRALSYCNRDMCTPVKPNSRQNTFSFTIISGSQGLMLHGTFGKDEGFYMPPSQSIISGIYSIENLDIPGNEGKNFEMEYYAECPLATTAGNFFVPGGSAMTYVNCALESNMFGKGLTTGATYIQRNPDPSNPLTYYGAGFNIHMFDDDMDEPRPNPPATTFGIDVNTSVPDVFFAIHADGIMSDTSSLEFNPLLNGHHFVQEAGVNYLKKFTSVNTDNDIFLLRKQFLTNLQQNHQINLNPDDFDDVPLDGVIDLGGGNRVEAYEVNHEANLRSLTKFSATSPHAAMPQGSRIKEGGYRLSVGRAGISTRHGHLPLGSLITEGKYIFENAGGEGVHQEMHFYSKTPFTSNTWFTGSIENVVISEDYGPGVVRLAVIPPMPGSRGPRVNIRGVLAFPDRALDFPSA